MLHCSPCASRFLDPWQTKLERRLAGQGGGHHGGACPAAVPLLLLHFDCIGFFVWKYTEFARVPLLDQVSVRVQVQPQGDGHFRDSCLYLLYRRRPPQFHEIDSVSIRLTQLNQLRRRLIWLVTAVVGVGTHVNGALNIRSIHSVKPYDQASLGKKHGSATSPLKSIRSEA